MRAKVGGRLRAGLLCLMCAGLPSLALAQAVDAPAPVAPAVISRNPAGRATLRAVRTATPLKIDGKLVEAIYRATEAVSNFI